MTAPTRPAPRGAAPAARRSDGVPAAALPTLPAGALVALARRGLVEAALAPTPAERYAAAHLAALRAAAAVLACRARPVRGGSRRRPTSAWSLLAAVAPEMAEWAGFFALGARKRAQAAAGLPSAATAREADDLLRDAETFVTGGEAALGLPRPLPLAAGA